MADREKVIKAINICLGHGVCNDCPYCLSGKGYTTMNCRDYMLRDALELLKEQENELTNEEALRFIEKLKSDNNELREKYSALLKEQEGKPLRCKTCTMRDKTGFCHRWNREVKDDDYCSFGAWKGC